MAETVALIFDPEFADALRDMTGREVWVIRSPKNSAVVDDLRRSGQTRLTTFEDYFEPEVEAFDEILGTIELHHGQYGQDPPFKDLEVYGLEFDESFVGSLQSIGFELRTRTPDGFTARRTSSTI